MTTPLPRLAVVTGASSGIGEALTRQLSARGTPVLAVARRKERLEAIAGAAAAAGHADVLPLAIDLAEPGADREVAETARRLGATSLLVNNAGFGSYGRFEAADPARLGAMVRLNCEALVLLTHALLADLAAARDGVVLNVASAAGFQPTPFMSVYGATKAFVLAFTEALDEEVRPRGVRALAFCPGPVRTEFGDVAGTGGRFHDVPGEISADEAAVAALDQVAARQVVAVPGPWNKAATTLGQLLPRGVVRWASGRILKPSEKP
jgi:short-subunit dehydrogenase